VLRWDEDPIGSMRVRTRERRIVAPDLSARPFRVGEEVQVVNGYDVGSVPGWKNEWMRRVSDVERLSRERLGRGPAEAMPGGVQHPPGDPPIDDRDAAEVANIGQPIFPRAGEQGEL